MSEDDNIPFIIPLNIFLPHQKESQKLVAVEKFNKEFDKGK